MSADLHKKNLKEQIKQHEGYRLDVYKDTLGFDTGGYGHKILPNEEIPTTKEGWDKLFDKDFDKAWSLADKFCDTHELDINIKAKCILCEMIYQMGSAGVSKFVTMISCLKSKDMNGAADAMLDSRWARQTPNRADSLSSQMRALSN
tara:strand:+ start:3121 stop:3561 length:441 start_codon:yes stop_codon:yes gene_type:complete